MQRGKYLKKEKKTIPKSKRIIELTRADKFWFPPDFKFKVALPKVQLIGSPPRKPATILTIAKDLSSLSRLNFVLAISSMILAVTRVSITTTILRGRASNQANGSKIIRAFDSVM